MSQDVVVYALSTCPWCKRAKEWFAAQQGARALGAEKGADDGDEKYHA